MDGKAGDAMEHDIEVKAHNMEKKFNKKEKADKKAEKEAEQKKSLH
jgi:hypothetical protein